MVASTQPGDAFAPAKLRPLPFGAQRLRYALLLLVGLVPVALDLTHHGEFVYLHSALAHFLAAAFCLVASRRFPAECTRWRLVGAALAAHSLSYLAATLFLFRWLTESRAAWLGNFGNALWLVLLIPALMGQRVGRGKIVRAMDGTLVAVSVVLVMASFGSGVDPGGGPVRIWTGIVLLALLTALAYSLRIADGRSGLRRFTFVLVRFLTVELADTFLINVLLHYYLPRTPDMIVDLLIPLPELLLCNWVLQTIAPQRLPRFPLDRTIVDSMQPSVLTVMSVALALYAFRNVPVLAAFAVVGVVICYAVRTQLYYAQLFRERSRLLSQATEYRQLATRDPLTGIGNRRWFEASLQAVFSNPDALPCSLLLVDTDHFKQVNDKYGHDAGDAVLCCIAEALHRETSQMDQPCIARIGGDEFAALLRHVSERDALAVADRIRGGVSQQCESLGFPVTVSVGATTTCSPVPRKQLMEAADAALYRAKAAGRNVAFGSAVS